MNKIEKLEELAENAKEIVEFLKTKNPHTQIIITDECIKITEDIASLPFKESEKEKAIKKEECFVPRHNEPFYLINEAGYIECRIFDRDRRSSTFLASIGNCYRTSDDAEKDRDLKIEERRMELKGENLYGTR